MSHHHSCVWNGKPFHGPYVCLFKYDAFGSLSMVRWLLGDRAEDHSAAGKYGVYRWFVCDRWRLAYEHDEIYLTQGKLVYRAFRVMLTYVDGNSTLPAGVAGYIDPRSGIPMEIILNSKYFAELSAAQLGEKVQALGYDGLDVCVRPGHPVHPGNVTMVLPEAVAVWAQQGLSCPLVTLATSFTDPLSEEAKATYAACAEAGVSMIKIGYFRFADGDDYWQRLEQARSDLEGFVQLSEKHGVKTCYHTHSGQCIGSNCAGLMHLIRGFDPACLGAYPDFGHMALDGEDIAMGLSMLRDHLCIVGIKDGFLAHRPGVDPPYEPKLAKVGEGSVHWHTAARTLNDMGFTGPWSVHTEYGIEAGTSALERMAREDATYLRRVASELGINPDTKPGEQ